MLVASLLTAGCGGKRTPNRIAVLETSMGTIKFELYNQVFMYEAKDRARMAYNQWIREEERANCCLQCGECGALVGTSGVCWLCGAPVVVDVEEADPVAVVVAVWVACIQRAAVRRDLGHDRGDFRWRWHEGNKVYGWGIACAYKNTGLGGGVMMDYGDVIVHIFYEPVRLFSGVRPEVDVGYEYLHSYHKRQNGLIWQANPFIKATVMGLVYKRGFLHQGSRRRNPKAFAAAVPALRVAVNAGCSLSDKRRLAQRERERERQCADRRCLTPTNSGRRLREADR